MARPIKQTIDYFPHHVTHGRTMFIVESRFGNDGYAFWFKLLETIGGKHGMFLDCNDVAEWEFLLAKTRVDEVIAVNILDTLAALGAIDGELWGSKIVYCQNLCDGVADAFRRRCEQKPTRDRVIAYRNSHAQGFLTTFTGKGKERKGKETITPPNPPKPVIEDKIDFVELKAIYSDVFRDLMPSVHICQQLEWIVENFDRQTITDVFASASSAKARTISYVTKSLRKILDAQDQDREMWEGMGETA